MVKFVDIPYVRPDMEAVLDRVQAAIQGLKTAKTYEAFRSAYMDYAQTDMELVTSQQLVYMRHTVNMLDAYYAAENAFFNTQMPRYSIAVKELRAVILSSPFKKDLEAEFGSFLIQDLEAKVLLSSEAVVDDLAKEANLASLYSKTVASASVEFNGETCSAPMLLKYMKSSDRTIRKGAFEAWSALYESIAPKIDEIYSDVVNTRISIGV